MKKILMTMLAAGAVAACQNSNPFLQEWDTPYGTAPFSKIQTSDYLPAIKEGIKQQKAEIDAIIANPAAPTFENTIAAYELSGALLDQVTGVFYNLSETDGTPEILALLDEVTPILSEAEDDIFMNPDLFARVKAVYEGADTLDREQQMVTKKLYDRFVRNGIALDEAGRARFKEINSRLAVLSQEFGKHLLAENNKFKEEVGITVSAYPDFMSSCESRSLREKAFRRILRAATTVTRTTTTPSSSRL